MKTSGFLYFIPAATCEQPVQLTEGDSTDGLQSGTLASDRLPPALGGLFANFNSVPNQIIQHRTLGPDGKGTLLIPKSTTGQTPPMIVYDSEKQYWSSCDGGSYWTGFVKDCPPHPSWFIERGAVVHWTIENLWSIGVYRSEDFERCDLPSAYSFAANGDVKTAVSKGYQTYFDLAGKALDHLTGVQKLTEPECVELVIELLRLNYRVGKDEFRIMFENGYEWLNSSMVQAVLMTVCDFETVVEHVTKDSEEKKSEPARDYELVMHGV